MRLIDKYLPSDYTDRVASTRTTERTLTAEQLFDQMFCHIPKPVKWLMAVRDTLVKPLGLRPGGSFRHLIIEQEDEEIVLGKNDRHLSFWVSIYCGKSIDGQLEASATTLVTFHNRMGRLYFVGIWGIHKILVKSLFRKATIQQLCRQ